jgi:hypothetical protein
MHASMFNLHIMYTACKQVGRMNIMAYDVFDSQLRPTLRIGLSSVALTARSQCWHWGGVTWFFFENMLLPLHGQWVVMYMWSQWNNLTEDLYQKYKIYYYQLYWYIVLYFSSRKRPSPWAARWGGGGVGGGLKTESSFSAKFGAIFKGTVQRDLLSPIFSLMDSSQAIYSGFKNFSNLALNSVRYSRFLIDSPL